jgi:hypothetical protein
VKKVVVKEGKTVHTPWLRPSEAAAYCSISRTLFDKLAAGLPHGGGRTVRIYHVNVLDDWIAGRLDVPFDPADPDEGQAPAKQPRRRREPVELVSRSGKVFGYDPLKTPARQKGASL